MKFVQAESPYANDTSEYFYCGIYKIVKRRPKEYYAYFIQEWQQNWGDHVCKPPHITVNGFPCWETFASAKAACIEHSKHYTPSEQIKRRADEILQEALQEAKSWLETA